MVELNRSVRYLPCLGHPTNKPMSSSTDQRLAPLDTLRGVAVLLVVALHCGFGFPAVLEGLRSFALAYGNYGVQMFFMISGFTMMLTFKGPVCKRSIYSFYIRRAFRIAPLFWAAGICYLLKDGFSPRYAAPNGVTWKDIVLTIPFLHWLTPTSFNSVVPGGWSIAVEMQFYVIFPLLCLFFARKKQSLIPYVAITSVYILSIAVTKWFFQGFLIAHLSPNEKHLADDFVFSWLPHQLPCFGLGFLLYSMVIKNECSIWGLALLALPVAASSSGFTILFLFLLCFFVFTLRITLPVITHLGVLSYSVYLVHFAVIDLVLAVGKRLAGWQLKFELAFPIVVLLSMAVSHYITRPLVEEPSIKWGKILINRLFPKTVELREAVPHV